MAEPFLWGSGGERLSPDAIKRRREIAQAMVKSGTDYSPVGHWTQGLARVAQALAGGYEEGKLDRAEKANTAEGQKLTEGMLDALLNGGAASPSAATAAPSFAGGGTARTMAMPNVTPEVKEGIVQTASALGIDPVDLATTISYETAGTFDPTKSGPRTQWGQHRGLIQFGEPQAKQHGVDWNNPVASQLGPNGAVASYLKAAGVQPGMGLMDIYSAINAGGVGRYGASDANNGGAPGTVADKVNNQMAGHRAKAQALFADLPAAGASPVMMGGTDPMGGEFFIPPGEEAAQAPAPMTANNFNAISEGRPLDPVFQTEGVGQPWMGTALPPQAAPQAQVAQVPLPPRRPVDLRADMPAAGSVPAIGQMPAPQPQPDLTSAENAGALQFAVQEGERRLGQPSANPVANVAQALAGSASAPAAQFASGSSGGAQQVAQVLAQSPNAALARALNDPSVSPAAKEIAGLIVKQRAAAKYGKSEFGLNPIYGVGPDGKAVILQMGKSGEVRQAPLPPGVSIARDPIKVEGPTGTTLLDPQTRQQVGFIPKEVARAEEEKVAGKSTGEAKADLPRVIANAEQMLGTIEGIRSHPGRNAWGATGKTAALPIIGNGIPGTEGRDFVRRVDQLKGKAFLEAFNSLKGGGQITEVEGQKATDAIARLDREQSQKGFDEALADLEAVVRAGIGRAKAKAGQGGTAPSQPSADGWNDVAPGVRIREKR